MITLVMRLIWDGYFSSEYTMKTYDVVLYECSLCAYATQFAGNAARHAATIKCSGGSMSGKSHRLVKFEDVAPAEAAVGRETITTVPGFECSACGYATGDRSNAAKHAKKCGAEIALAHLRVSVLSTRPRVAAPRFRMAERAKKEAAERAEEKARKEAERAEEKARKEAERAEEKARKEAERAEEKARKEAERAEEKARKEAERAEEKARREAETSETSGGDVAAEEAPKLERPDANMRTDMMRAIPRLGAQKMDITSIEDLPALLFRAARGTDAPARHLAVDGNAVLEMRPTGGTERTSIDKFVRRVVAFAADACVACGGQDLRDELDAKDFAGARGGRESRSDLIRMYSSGDHRYYRASCEGKDFVRRAADAVKAELDALRAGG